MAKYFTIDSVRLLALIAAVCLCSCRLQPSAAEPFTLRVGLYSVQDYLPFFVIQERQIDRRHGLNLVMEQKLYPGGAAIIEAIAAKSVDAGIAGSVPVIAAAAQGVIPGNVVAIAANNFADRNYPGAGVLTAAQVNTWKDLEGKHIAVNAVNSIQTVAIKRRLEMEHVQNYQLVEISFANMGLAIAGGNVEAAAMYEPFLTQSLLRGDGKLLGWIIGGPPFEYMESTLIVMSADLYRNHKPSAKSFLRAYLEALRWINRNPDQARAVLTKRMELSDEVGRKIKLLRWPVDGRSDPTSLEQIQSVMMDVGMLKTRVAPDMIYDETLLKQVAAESR